MVSEDKLSALWSQKESAIAHDLTNFFSVLNMRIDILAQTLPNLLKAYQLAVKNNLIEAEITDNYFKLLEDNFILKMKGEITKKRNLMQFHLYCNTQITSVSKIHKLLSAKEYVREALENYPFADNHQRNLVQFNSDNDFQFKCAPIFITSLFRNFLDNALYGIEEAGKGSINIWLGKEGAFNAFHFKDTGIGLDSYKMEHIFYRFTSNREGKIMPGLGLCYLAITYVGGDIICNSVPGEYTHFTVLFPCNSCETIGNCRLEPKND
jgi:signal transduction histidine kinase